MMMIVIITINETYIRSFYLAIYIRIFEQSESKNERECRIFYTNVTLTWTRATSCITSA